MGEVTRPSSASQRWKRATNGSDMRHYFFMTLVAGFLCSHSLITSAVEMRGINTAEVVVQDQSQASLHKALPVALNYVLVKVSGNPDVKTLPAVQNALPKINNLIASYSYLTQTSALGKPQLMLQVVFDQQAIKQLLTNAGQAIWGSNRPLTLVWLSVPTELDRVVLSSDSTHPLMNSVKQLVAERGIPVIFPTMDLEDQTNMNLISSRLPSREQLDAVAKRYGVESVLVASIEAMNAGAMVSEWELLLHGTAIEWQTSAPNMNQVVVNGIDRAVDMMVNRLATMDSKHMQSTVTMKVTGVHNLNDYVHVVAALRRLTPVTQVTVSDMGNNALELVIHAAGGKEGLVNVLKDVPHFTAETAPMADANGKQEDLLYHWENAADVNPVKSNDNTTNLTR